MELTKTLIKTDKNGTKYYDATIRCDKCHGTGYLACFKHVEAGVCFQCNGTGINHTCYKEYTEAYAAKLAARADAKKAREEAKEAERRASWSVEKELVEMGYGKQIGLVIDAKDISARLYYDTAKMLKYEADCNILDYIYSITNVDNNVAEKTHGMYQVIPVSWDEIFDVDYENCHIIPKGTAELCDSINNAVEKRTYSQPPKPVYVSEYVGTEGEKVSLKVKLIHVGGFDTQYGPA